MPIEVRWLNQNKRFLLLHFVDGGIESWQEYDDAITQAWSMAKTVEHPIVSILVAYDTPMPFGSPLPHIERAIARFPNNILFGISIVESSFETLMLDMVAQLDLEKRLYTVSSWDGVNKLLASKNLPLVPLEDVPPHK